MKLLNFSKTLITLLTLLMFWSMLPQEVEAQRPKRATLSPMSKKGSDLNKMSNKQLQFFFEAELKKGVKTVRSSNSDIQVSAEWIKSKSAKSKFNYQSWGGKIVMKSIVPKNTFGILADKSGKVVLTTPVQPDGKFNFDLSDLLGNKVPSRLTFYLSIKKPEMPEPTYFKYSLLPRYTGDTLVVLSN